MSIDGTWNVEASGPQGTNSFTMVAVSSGSTFTGTIKGPQGNIDIENGQMDGDKATWESNITQPMAIKLEFAAVLAGDTFEGEAKFGTFGSGKITGKKA